MSDEKRCPVKDCKFVFLSSHYTDREPHLRDEHNISQLARTIQILLGRVKWADTMATEIIDACKTLLIRKETTHDE